jgi:lipoprotein LprG
VTARDIGDVAAHCDEPWSAAPGWGRTRPWQAVRVRTADRPTLSVRIAVALLAVLALSACKGGSSDSAKAPSDRLAAAKTSLDDADYIGFAIEADSLPDGVGDALKKAVGTGTHAPAFTGNVDVQTSVSISAPIISVDGKVYAQLPIVGWRDIDPADYGAPDPAALMDTDTGLSSLFTQTVEPTAGDQVREGDQVLDTIHGTIPGDAVKAIFPSAGDGDFDVTYALTSDDAIDAVDVTGPFYGDSGDVTYRLTFDLDADPVDIQPPS